MIIFTNSPSRKSGGDFFTLFDSESLGLRDEDDPVRMMLEK